MLKIIFVDDEFYLLEGIKRMLRSKKDEWDMTFIESANTAVELISQNKYDIIATDNKMQEMDGTELLTRVKEISPFTVRILMSGQPESEITEEAGSIIQGFIAKPFEAETLIEMLNSYKEK